jgi:hypothetical protein
MGGNASALRWGNNPAFECTDDKSVRIASFQAETATEHLRTQVYNVTARLNKTAN